MNENELHRNVRSPEGRALAKSAARKIGSPAKLDLVTAVKARAACRKMIEGVELTRAEIGAYDFLVSRLRPSQPPRDDVSLSLQRHFLDGSPKEQAVIKNVLREMARIADAEACLAPTAPLFKAAPRKRSKLGLFF
jgi:hypothetical protein